LGDQQTGGNASPPSKPPVIPLGPWCVAKIKGYLHKRRADHEKKTPQDRFARRTADATVCIAILAVVAAVVGSLQYCSISGQLNEMQTEQRPWVSIDPKDGIGLFRPLAFGVDSVPYMLVKFVIRNTAINRR